MSEEIHHVLHYLYLKGYNAKGAMNEIHSVYNTSYPSYSTTKEIFKEFKKPEIIVSEMNKGISSHRMEKCDEIQRVLEENPNA